MGINALKFQGINFLDIMKETKLFLFNRTCNFYPPVLADLKKKYGFKVCVDLDDFWTLHPRHNMSTIWRLGGTEELLKSFVSLADAVTVTTARLAEQVQTLNKNVHVIPNALPYGQGQFLDARFESEKMRFLYAGGGTHFWDLKTLTIPFSKVNVSKTFDNSEFILCGYHADPNHPESEREWNKIESTFNLNGKLKNYVRRTTIPLTHYMDHYRHCDVAIIPLEDNNFNKFKSNLKVLESGCNNSPVIVSDVEPYSNEPERSHLMFAKNAREWYEHLEYCAKNPNFVLDKGKELGEYVRANYYLPKVNEYRKQLFESLMH
jgi:glycosyltransferase involved in cell wall biosynthesis